MSFQLWIKTKVERSSNFSTWKENSQQKSNWGWMLFLGIHHLYFPPWVFGFRNSSVIARKWNTFRMSKNGYNTRNCG